MRYQSRMHPTLDILCDSMGRVFVPENGPRKAHWTFGSLKSNGYRTGKLDGKAYKVARLICETFHGLAPEDRPTCDHIDRNRDSNVPENLRWASRKTQESNKQSVDDSLAKYGVRYCDDSAAYQRARRAKNPELAEQHRAECREWRAKNAERQRALCREWRAKQKALRLVAKEN